MTIWAVPHSDAVSGSIEFAKRWRPDVIHVHDPSQVYPTGAHLAAVEIDPVSFVPEVVAYIAVEDCGRIIHPDVVDGQIRGGVAMGIGEVLFEAHTYADDGRLTTTTLRDYLLPLTTTVPPIGVRHHQSPTPATPLGSKGVGEAGTIGAFGAVANAVADAVAAFDIDLDELPYTPERIFAAISRRAGQGSPLLQEPERGAVPASLLRYADRREG